MNKKELKQLLDELYAIDPGLREHEQELTALLQKLAQAKPDLTINKQFVARLRSQLMNQETKPSFFSNWNLALGGGLVAITMVVIAVFTFSMSGTSLQNPGGDIFLTRSVTPVGDHAFGSLSPAPSLSPEEARQMVSSQTASPAVNPVPGFGGGGGLVTDEDARMVLTPQDFVRYTYVYTGGFLPLDEEEGTVYRRVRSGQGSAQVARQLGQLGFGLVDINSFSNLQADTITLSENRQNGYSLYVDFFEESMFISPNWRQWEEDIALQPLRMNQLPAEASIIEIANRFLAQRGIDVSAFGQPMINRDFERWVIQAEPGAEVYAPDELQVVYPLQFDSQQVHENYGFAYGITVSVNVRNNRVTNVSNLFTQNYESSAYALETDSQVILDLAAQGGVERPYFFDESTSRTEELELDRVERIYMRHWQNSETESQELFVPALRFHVKEGQASGQQVPPEYIIIPLVTDIIEEIQNRPQPMPVEPFPLPAIEEPLSVIEPEEAVE